MLTVIDQLAGVPIPASAVEPLVLATRVRDYSPALLDELMASGEVLWSGAGSLPGNDGWISLHVAESAALTLSPAEDYLPGALALRVQEFLSSGGAYFFQQLRLGLSDTELPSDEALTSALWELVWAGRVGNDTFAPVRGMLDGGHTAHKQKARTPRLRPGRLPGAQGAGRYAGLSRPATPMGSPMVGGRWSSFAVTAEVLEPTVRAHAMAELLMDRYGVVTRGSVAAEGQPGGFALMYKVLSRLEEQGRSRRGYFIEKLGAAQFAVPATVDRLRTFATDFSAEQPTLSALALAATDPANPYGAALIWPSLEGSGHRPGRKAGALVVLVDGELVLYVERGGKTVLCFATEPVVIAAAASALVKLVKRGATERLAIEKVNGGEVLGTLLASELLAAGAYSTPRGVRIRA